MFGSPVVAIVALTLMFAFLYAGIKNQNIVDVLTGKTTPTPADYAAGGKALGQALNGAAAAPFATTHPGA